MPPMMTSDDLMSVAHFFDVLTRDEICVGARFAEKLKDQCRNFPQHLCCIFNSSKILKHLIDLNWNPNVRNAFGDSPLHLSVLSQNRICFDIMIESPNVDLNSLNKRGETPLHYAAHQGDDYMVSRLILKGANLDISSPCAGTPAFVALRFALCGGNDCVLRLLIDANANLDIVSCGYSMLSYSARKSSMIYVSLLLSKGAKPNILCGGPEYTHVKVFQPIHWAVHRREPNVDLIRLLCSSGADMSIRDHANLLPVEMAAMRGLNEVVDILFPSTPRPSVVAYVWSIDSIMSHFASPAVKTAAQKTISDYVDACTHRTELAYEAGRFHNALLLCMQVARYMPGWSEKLEISSTYLVMFEGQAALRLAHEALQLYIANPLPGRENSVLAVVYVHIGKAHLVLRQFDQAIAAFLFARVLKPSSSWDDLLKNTRRRRRRISSIKGLYGYFPSYPFQLCPSLAIEN